VLASTSDTIHEATKELEVLASVIGHFKTSHLWSLQNRPLSRGVFID